MRRLQIGAALLVMASASYAWSASPDEFLGRTKPKVTGRPSAASSARAAPPDLALSGDRVAEVLDGLTPDRNATRGANETRVYQNASAAVVMVISGDSLGSGVLIGGDGIIVTNHHVVGDADEVGVVFKPKVEGTEVTEADMKLAKVIRRDEVADLALLQVKDLPAGVAPLQLGDAASVEIGEDVHAIGHPTGYSWTYTRGVVSQIRRDHAWQDESRIPHKATLIQTQTPINPGNSGGPLIDDQLRVVGINTAGAEGEGLNYAVSADDVKAFLDRKEDRLVNQAGKGKANGKGAKACEPEAIAMEKSGEDDGVYYEMDGDCDGESDWLTFVPNSDKDAILTMFDDDGDGKIDTVYSDDDQDGDFEFVIYDTDGDEKPDLRGLFKDGEEEPYRLEKITG